MLQVAVERLKNLYPTASIEVFTSSPEGLVHRCPDAQPLLTSGRKLWSFPLAAKFHKLMPNSWTAQRWLKLEETIRYSFPSLARSFINLKLSSKPEGKDFRTFMDTMYRADLVVTCGGGYIADAFYQSASAALDTLRLAAKLGKVTAMFGLGLGPIQDSTLLAKAKATLPLVNLIALREKRAGIKLLNSIGISPNSILITGDDAIELAHKFRSKEIGNGVGVNLRYSEYSNLDSTTLEIIKSALHEVAGQHYSPLIPAPISHTTYQGYEDPDSLTIQKLLQGYDNTSDGGQQLDTPQKVIESIGRCRVVVTGSYHAGVFALSQGIPVVCLAKSHYYLDKFLGLADQFGTGCDVVLLSDQNLRETLMTKLNHAWNISEQVRPQLLKSAQQQIDAGRLAYRQVYELVESRSYS